MSPNPYDQACRYLLRLFGVPMLAWLVRLKAEQVEFVGWLETRNLPWPGQPDRYCDTVAHLRDPRQGGRPYALVVEFQITPDAEMFGRALSYLGELWRARKPTEHRGDRFDLGLVVVNLTGRGSVSRDTRLLGTCLRIRIDAGEWNLCDLDAATILRAIRRGAAPRGLLVWVPLFNGGNEPGIILEWQRLAARTTDTEQRQALGLTLVFAEAVGAADTWRRALEGWNVTESQIVKEWTAQAREAGVLEGKIEALEEVLEARFQKLPADLIGAIRACVEPEKLREAMRQAALARSLTDFRRKTGL